MHRRRLSSWPDLWFPDPKHVVLAMHLADKPAPLNRSPAPAPAPDLTALLSDELLLRILSALSSPLHSQASLVCKRWLRLLGRLRRSVVLRDWSLLPRLPLRFPELADLDLVPASFSPPLCPAPGVLLSRAALSFPLDLHSDPPVGCSEFILDDAIDRGLETLARGLPNLTRLALVVPAATEPGLMAVAAECATLQELELHRCTDLALRPISLFENLQILRLVGSVEGLYGGPGVTDIGLTILAHGCKRLVRLELAGCEGSYDGIAAMGRCCAMLEELTLCDHRMDAGWTAALAFCGNLKTLRLVSCRRIDDDPGLLEHIEACPTIERLQMQKCQLRDKRSLHALFVACEAVREIMFQDCWGLDNDMFGITSICRRVKFLSLEGCSQLTTEGLESVILSWKDLQSLIVVSCNNIKDGEVTPALSSLFSALKDFKWRPDSRSVLVSSLAGTGMGRKGGRLLKRG